MTANLRATSYPKPPAPHSSPKARPKRLSSFGAADQTAMSVRHPGGKVLKTGQNPDRYAPTASPTSRSKTITSREQIRLTMLSELTYDQRLVLQSMARTGMIFCVESSTVAPKMKLSKALRWRTWSGWRGKSIWKRETREEIQVFWHGRALSPLEHACLTSFLQKGINVRIFSYGELSIPRGAVLENAADILPAEDLFLFEGSPSAFTNIFRYKLLFQRGGWWLDSDVVLLKDNLPKCDFYWAREDRFRINGAILKFPAGDVRCEKLLMMSLEQVRSLHQWGQLGPGLLSEVLGRENPTGLMGSTAETYPLHWLEWHCLWLPEYLATVNDRLQFATFLHLWNSVSVRAGIDTALAPPAGSYLHGLCRSASRNATAWHTEARVRECAQKYFEQEWVSRAWNEIFSDLDNKGHLEQ
jgi:hypothetical protein